jgi:thiamine pyrophosphokinase
MSGKGHALILADGEVGSRQALDAAWPGWSDAIDLVIAADGGARHAESLGFTIDLWVGDGDSLPPPDLDRLRAAGVAIERSPVEKDQSDTELAIDAAVARGAAAITILGGFGGRRVDHAFANGALLGLPVLTGRRVVLLDVGARVRTVRAPGIAGETITASLAGGIGDLVSLLPVGGSVEGIATSGLRYPLAGETLGIGSTRGLSNVRTERDATVRLRRGFLLVIETPATLTG